MFRTEGVIVKAASFQEKHRLLHVFTPEGILKLFVKEAFGKKFGNGVWTELLIQAEFVCRPGKEDLHYCQEISIQNTHYSLRQRFETLECAMQLIKAIQMSQAGQRSSPALYRLLVLCLEKLPLMENPQAIAACFYLKLLLHEGLLSLETKEAFSDNENQLIFGLAACRSFADLAQISLPEGFMERIAHYFRESL
jgi:DNA repair protein RecO